jgi:hypothetical protein
VDQSPFERRTAVKVALREMFLSQPAKAAQMVCPGTSPWELVLLAQAREVTLNFASVKV